MTEHHATVFEGDSDAITEVAHRFVHNALNMVVEANPDVSIHVYEQLTVEDAHTLKQRASLAPLGDTQVFLLTFERATREAQNALLKLLEEPGDGTYFVLMVPTVEFLLPTVRSRLAHGGRSTATPAEDVDLARTFLQATTNERLHLLEPIIKEKDRSRARRIVDALESVLHTAGVHGNAQALREVAFVRQYVADTSSSLKMLLEHLAVTL